MITPAEQPGVGTPQQFGRSYGLLVAKSNADLDREAASMQQWQESQNNFRTYNLVSAYFSSCYQEAVRARSENGIDQELIRDLAQRKCEYTTEQKAKLAAQDEPDIFDPQTEVKCAAGNAWISDVIVFQPDEKPWALRPTAIPELSEEEEQRIVEQVLLEVLQAELQGALQPGIMLQPAQRQKIVQEIILRRASEIRSQIQQQIKEEADSKARNMEKLITDQLEEGEFAEAFESFLDDFVTFRTAWLRGPIVMNKESMDFIPDPYGDGVIPTIVRQLGYSFSSPSPLDMYPSREATGPDDGMIHERIRFRRRDMDMLYGTEGVNDGELRQALQEHQYGGSTMFQATDSQRAMLLDRKFVYDPKETIEGIHSVGYVMGRHLNEWYGEDRVQGDYTDEMEYPVEAIIVKNRVVKLSINPDRLGGSGYYAASYRRVKGSIWGKSIPSLMRDKQKMINACARSIAINMGFLAGPMAWIDPSGLLPGEDVTRLYPRQIMQLRKNPDGSTTRPMDFYSYPSHIQDLIKLRENLCRQTDDETGIPPYTYGNEKVGGAGQTATGLELLMSSAARGVKKSIANIDKGVVKPLIKRMWLMNMLYHDDQSVKGDVNIVARGAMSLFVKETVTARRMQLLSAQSGNPLDQVIFSISNRANMWREIYRGMNISTDGMIPDDEELERRVQAAVSANQPQQQNSLATPPVGGTGEGSEVQQPQQAAAPQMQR